MLKSRMSLTLTLFTSLLLISCVSFVIPIISTSDIDPELRPYVESFYDDAEARGFYFDRENVKVRLGTIPNFNRDDQYVTVGLCFTVAGETMRPEIVIDEKFFRNASPAKIEALVYHELGHCALNRSHWKVSLKRSFDAMAVSLMYPYLFDEADYLQYRNYYIDELFTNVPLDVMIRNYQNPIVKFSCQSLRPY